MATMAMAMKRLDKATTIAFGCIVLLLAVGAIAEPNFLSLRLSLQQLQTASFLGVIATGVMLVILLGHIDLSIPWTIGDRRHDGDRGDRLLRSHAGRRCSPSPSASPAASPWASSTASASPILRAPSMIFTLGMNAVAQGLMVYHTGGFAPQDRAIPFMRELAVGRLIPGVPNPLLIWLVVGAATVFMLTRTTLGRQIYAIGNKERAVYLSGVDTRRVLLICFVISGACAAAGGVLLAGWANRSYQAMGDPYLLPTIAAIVLGGTNVLGGRGTYLGTVAGVILITLLQSILSVVQPQQFFADLGFKMPAEAVRQIVFGVVIIGMLLLYGRERLQR